MSFIQLGVPAPDFHNVPSFPTLKNTSRTVGSNPERSISFTTHARHVSVPAGATRHLRSVGVEAPPANARAFPGLAFRDRFPNASAGAAGDGEGAGGQTPPRAPPSVG